MKRKKAIGILSLGVVGLASLVSLFVTYNDFKKTHSITSAQKSNQAMSNNPAPSNSIQSSDSVSSTNASTNKHTGQQPQGGCEKTNIIPYKTVTEERSYIPRGETGGYGGQDGYTYECPGLSGPNAKTIYTPHDKIIYIGTGKTQAEKDTDKRKAEEVARQQALVTANNARQGRIQHCYKSARSGLGAIGAANDEAYIRSICDTIQ